MFVQIIRRKILLYILSAGIFAASAVYITFPLAFRIGNLATNLRDELLISWIHVSVLRNIFSDPLNLFEANIFYPFHSVLSYSDLHLSSALISGVPYLISGEPISTLNTTLIFSLFLLGFAAFVQTYSVTKSFFSGILAGLLLQYSPVTLDKNVHVQILAIGWVLLAVFFYNKWLEKRKFSYFLLTLLFFQIQVWNSFLPGYFILFSCTILTIFTLVRSRQNVFNLFQMKHVISLLISTVILLPLIIPYFQTAHEFSFRRDIREAVHLSLQPEDLFYPNDLTRLWPLLHYFSQNNNYPENAEYKVGYIGFVFLLLSITSFCYAIQNRKRLSVFLLSILVIAVVGLILSFGPVLHLERRTVHLPFVIPLPYALFYYLIPGFQGIRAAYRWEMLFVLYMSVSVSLVVALIIDKFTVFKKCSLYFLMFFLIVAEYNPMRLYKVPQKIEFPKVYEVVKKLDTNAAIIEMPIYNWSMAPYSTQELMRVYYSSVHNLKMVNGASGFSPPPWQRQVTDLLQKFPSESSLRRMKSLGIKYIIVHSREYATLKNDGYRVLGTEMQAGDDVVKSLMLSKKVRLIQQVDQDYIFMLL
ncbi:MAG: hypothetical protein RLZZ455_1021 [Candidatus Parcubacteria bacterium]|jgi:hypothetical protein